MITQLPSYLKRSGYSLTISRSDVFDVLALRGALSPSELVFACVRCNAASVYRTLNLFRQLGIVQDVVIAGQRKVELTDRFSRHHHHLTCRACGCTAAVDDPALEQALGRLVGRHGYSDSRHTLEITGICPACSC